MKKFENDPGTKTDDIGYLFQLIAPYAVKVILLISIVVVTIFADDKTRWRVLPFLMGGEGIALMGGKNKE